MSCCEGRQYITVPRLETGLGPGGCVADIEDVMALLAEVQSQLAFQEDTVASLNEALASQQQEILVLRRQLELLKQRQDEQAAQSVPETAAQERPPHY